MKFPPSAAAAVMQKKLPAASEVPPVVSVEREALVAPAALVKWRARLAKSHLMGSLFCSESASAQEKIDGNRYNSDKATKS